MKIAVLEYFTSLPAGRRDPDLAAEGKAIRDAIVADLSRLPGAEVVVVGRRQAIFGKMQSSKRCNHMAFSLATMEKAGFCTFLKCRIAASPTSKICSKKAIKSMLRLSMLTKKQANCASRASHFWKNQKATSNPRRVKNAMTEEVEVAATAAATEAIAEVVMTVAAAVVAMAAAIEVVAAAVATTVEVAAAVAVFVVKN